MNARFRFTVTDMRGALAAMALVDEIQAEAKEFAERLADKTGVADFLDIPTGDAFDVSPESAIAFFRSKGLRTTFSYADMRGEAHDHAFTVAKMMDVDMLAQVRASLDSALANGTPFKQWSREIEPLLKSGGWWGQADMVDPQTGNVVRAQLGSPWRLETIFRTNMQTAYAAQQWEEIVSQSDTAPWLMYDAVDDFRTREQHRRWDRTVLPWNDPWFKTHTPPCGYNCRCGLIQLSEDDLASMGLTPTPAPEDGTYKWRNPRTGIVERVPDGVDPGFDHNPGETYLADIGRLLAEKIGALPSSMAAAARAGVATGTTESVVGRASAIVVDTSGDVETAAHLNQLISGPVIGYIEARLIGIAPTIEQIEAFNRLPLSDRREIERQISLGS